MTKKINCQDKQKQRGNLIKVRIIKAPLVNTRELKQVLTARARALVL
ncbi:hypothetical protein KAR28_06540 [Candidatus Parcubacteria bacterium]|nr:hypothetical protein [Candidatus Parcubacteria bacterium]